MRADLMGPEEYLTAVLDAMDRIRDDPAASRRLPWLYDLLGGVAPVDLIRLGRGQEVLDALHDIRHGALA